MRSRLALLLVVLLFAAGRGVQGEPAYADLSAPNIKAAYLYNFSLYTEWPGPPVDGFHLCIIGRDPVASAIDALDGRLLRGKPLIVQHLDGGDQVGTCHVLYVGALTSGQRAALGRALGQLPVLTVGESRQGDEFAPIVQLIPVGAHIAFEIDLGKARTAGLTLSSRLLGLARAVH
ncbi:MAG: YfiR family protein [Bacteroidota bacterium]